MARMPLLPSKSGFTAAATIVREPERLEQCSAYVLSCPVKEILSVSSFNASPSVVAALLGQAPAVARLGLSSSDARLRDRSADALAAFVADHLDRPDIDPNQLVLPL